MPDPTPYPWDERRWPTAAVLLAPLLAIVCPAAVARRLDRVSLGLAWGVHAAGVAFALLVAFMLEVWQRMPIGGHFAKHLVNEMSDRLALPDRPDQWVSLIMVLVLSAALIEAVTLLAAWSMTAWAARAEPFSQSFRRALSRMWLITPHAVFYLTVFGAVAVLLDRLRSAWYRRHRDNGGFYSNWGDMPWYLRHEEYIMIPLWLFLAGLLSVVVWRAFASRGWGAYCRWPPHCEGCGYNLIGQQCEGTCPECGLPVLASTRDSARDRMLLRPGRRVTLADWFWCSRKAVARPTTLGRHLRVLTPTRGRWSFLLNNLALISAVNSVGLFSFWLIAMLESSQSLDADDIMELCLIWLILTSVFALFAWMVMFAGASVVGTSARLATGRNLLPLAMQGTLCLGWLLAIWSAIGWGLVIGLYVLFEIIELRPRQAWGLDREVFFFAAMLGTAVLLLLSYLYWLGKITWAGRYANQ